MNSGEISSSRIKYACQQWLKDREQKIQEKKEERITEMMKPRFFGLIQFNRERAIRWLENSEYDSYNTCEWLWYEEKIRVEELLYLVRAVRDVPVENDLIRIDSEMASTLSKYLIKY